MFGLFKAQSEQGLIFHWPLDEDSGVNANERKSKGDGSLINMTGSEWTTGKIGGALDFSGVDDYVNVSSQSSEFPLVASPRTVAAWYDIDSGRDAILAYGTDLSGQAFKCVVGGIGPELDFNAHRWGPNIMVPAGFNHVAYVVPNGAVNTDDCLIYFNGSLQISSTINGSPKTLNTVDSGVAHIGTNIAISAFLEGRVDELRIYNRALTAAQIAGLAELGI